ncbi:MAG: hypothetical protein NC300_02140 [Bacteroidales bacterium]|nr:hypothetical protein [Clostridium sp.]MCM1202925.1 hypothetical protein [Bacteroidales bacterium]
MSAVSVIIGVFLLGLTGHAQYIYFLLIFLAAAGLLAFIADFSVVKGEKASLKKRLVSFVNPSIIALTFIFIYSVIAFHGTIFTYPDEIFQWGPAVRYMVEKGQLPYGTDFSGASVTLSTATMFQYLWAGFKTFNESNCFIGNFLLAMIPVYLPFSGATWKDWKKIGAYTLVVFLSLNVLTYVKYYNLLQDFVLPMWAGGIIAWLLWQKKKELNWGLLLGMLMCIGSMKSMVSPLFAVMIIIVLMIRQVLIYRPGKVKDLLNRKVILLSGAVLLSVVIFSIVWSALINQNVYNRFSVFDSRYKSLSGIAKGIINGIFTVYSGTTGSFPYYSYFMVFIFEAVGMLILRKKFSNLEEKQKCTIIFSLYLIGFVAYLLVMLYAYARIFGAAESAIVAGLERYLAYYMLLGCIPWLSLLFSDDYLERGRYLKTVRVAMIILLVLGTGSSFISKISVVGIEDNSAYQMREEIQEQVDMMNTLTGGDGKVCILGVISYDESKMFAYELERRYSWNTDCYQMYHRQLEDVETFCDMVRYPQLIEQQQYDYMWIYHYDDLMESEQIKNIQYKYGLKKLKDGDLYQVEKSSGESRMIYLGNTLDMIEEE